MADCYLLKQDDARGYWVEQKKQKCAYTRSVITQRCTDLQDKGEYVCSKLEEKGHQACDAWAKNCCTWTPCKQICNSFTWVCNSWVWLVDKVCTASTWVPKMVCLATANFTEAICMAWVWTTDKVWMVVSNAVYLLCRSPEWFTNQTLNRQLEILVRWQKRHPKDTPRNPIEKKGWELTFSDDFDTGEVDYNKWIDHAWWGDRFEHAEEIPLGTFPTRYFSPTNFEFTATTIRMIANNIPTQITYQNVTFSIPYSEGHLEWKHPIRQKHGYFEIRCKMPDTTETWPAFWLASKDSWPPEIDIFEYYSVKPHKFETSQHWGTLLSHKMQTKKHSVFTAETHFHIYACEWNANQIRWYYDNHLIRIATNGLSEFIHPLHVIINNGVDTRDGHQPENAAYPHIFEVDYIRAYSKL